MVSPLKLRETGKQKHMTWTSQSMQSQGLQVMMRLAWNSEARWQGHQFQKHFFSGKILMYGLHYQTLQQCHSQLKLMAMEGY